MSSSAGSATGTNLFNEAEPEKQKDPEKGVDYEQRFVIKCVCGKKGSVYLRHYERVKCDCGRLYWALKPKRNGPMQIFPWPGDTRTLTPAAKP